MIKIEIKSIFGEVLFTYECEDNTIKKTVEKAVKENANLENANLFNVNLFNANLENANLRYADLGNANLEDANLFNANLENANLRYANLFNANLEDANLFNANLFNANLEDVKKDFERVLNTEHTYLYLFKLELLKGFVDGSNYNDKCSCLCGTLKKRGNKDIQENIKKVQDSDSPIEKFLLGIRRGMTPLYNDLAKIVYDWTCEYIEKNNVKNCLNEEEIKILEYLEREYNRVKEDDN